MQVAQTIQVHIDLAATSWLQWPEDAKRVARGLLERPHTQRQFYAELPAMRHSWLAAKVEAALATPADSEWGLL